MKTIMAVLFSILAVIAFTQNTFEYKNGQWFDGARFVRKTFYSVNGNLTEKRPKNIEQSFDLKKGFIIPAFGDAHCHHFDNPYNVKPIIQTYLREGIFYAKVTGNPSRTLKETTPLLNKPDSVDVSYANGALTADFGHPIEVYEGLALGVFDDAAKLRKSRIYENDAYYILNDEADLNKKWQQILKTKPDFIKVMLVNSEEYEKRKDRADTVGDRGLDPKLLPKIVTKAHDAGLKVAAHVDTSADFHNALLAEVDIMAHLPGYGTEAVELSESDLKLAAKNDVVIVPTANRCETYGLNREQLEKVQAAQIQNLQRIKKLGIKIAVGTDRYGTSSSLEAKYLRDLGIFTNLELLKMWCETTPQTVFPKRLIGRLKEGFEANFLVLKNDPLKDFKAVEEILMRFKNGILLKIEEEKKN